MKTLLFSILLLCLIFGFSASHVNAKDKKNSLIGEWIYEVSESPEEYKTGSLIFSEKEGEIVCIVKVAAGELPTSSLKIEDKKITFTAYVDGSPVNVLLTLEDNQLNGTVESPEGPKEIKALKKIQE